MSYDWVHICTQSKTQKNIRKFTTPNHTQPNFLSKIQIDNEASLTRELTM